MSYLQHGHIEQAFYERSDKSYLDSSNKSFLDRSNSSFLEAPSESFLTASNNSFLENNVDNKSYLDSQSTTYLTINVGTSNIEVNNTSFMETSTTSYLDLVAPSTEKAQWLEEDRGKHVTVDKQHHLNEDNTNHLEESGGETSDEENEDFSHTIDWELVVPPYIKPVFDNGATKYKCGLTNRIYTEMPTIPERFDVFDFDKLKLIETIGRYHTKKSKQDVDGKQKYRQLMSKQKDLHSTELQSLALENLRVWKHKKEQELLGQVKIQNADYSERKDRMGVGDHSSGGAAERKRRREALKKQQLEQRRKQQENKERAKQERLLKSQEEIANKIKYSQQRQQQQKNAMRQRLAQKQQDEMYRNQLRAQERDKLHTFVKIESKNISKQRQEDISNAMYSNLDAKSQENLWRQQQRSEDLKKKQDFVKIESKYISQQRKQQRLDVMNMDLDEKYNDQQQQRIAKRDQFDSFLNSMQKSQEDARANIANERSNRFQQQEQDAKRKADAILRQRRENEANVRRQEQERLRKMEIKNYVTKINNLLDVKSCGIDFDEFGNEFYFKYNIDWNPESVLGLRDLEDIFRSNGLSSTVEIIYGPMSKRAISRKHYQKIKIISQNTNDILTVLAISDNIDGAIRQLRQMINQREKDKQQKQQREYKQKQDRQQRLQQRINNLSSNTRGGGYGAKIDYSANNNWGLPYGWRVKKTAQGRLFFVNDTTKSTQWDDPRPLPVGWRSGKTPKGRTFYINDSTKSTQWNDPRPKIWV